MTAAAGEPPLPLLMRRDEVIRIDAAAHHAGRNQKTIRRWCREFGIGRQAGSHGPLEISRVGLEMVMAGDLTALELLRAGQRDHPRVARFFEFVGLPI